jgi:hypothetical protein
VPFTFGQVFKSGTVPASSQLVGALPDGSLVPLQSDVKSVYPDGSIKHAVISGVLPQLPAGESLALSLQLGQSESGACAKPADLVAAGFATEINLTIAGKHYRARAQDALQSGAANTWLCGGIATEWIASAAFTSIDPGDAGTQESHLTARFAVRQYPGAKSAKVDVIVENDWAYDPSPQNITYDVAVNVGGQAAYARTALTHYSHARWKKTFWWGDSPEAGALAAGADPAPKLHIRHDPNYLIATGAVPNYDPDVVISAATIADTAAQFASNAEPMATGLTMPYMPTTGGRPDIGLLPGWVVSYLLSQEGSAKGAMLGTADLAGSFSIHYRDQNTGKPISIIDYPYMTLRGNYGDTYNPATKQHEAFPVCAGSCTTPNIADTAHQPSLAFLPYLVTGDHYYLEELEFWAAYNMFSSNPAYRKYAEGLVYSDQVRAQAWILRSLAEAAYIVPDDDPLKKQFAGFLSNNIDWYVKTYTGNATTGNALGILTNGYAFSYDNGTAIAPWQDDFFTSAVGRAIELGFASAKPLLQWKARFPVSRMVDPGYCWILGSTYSLKVKDASGMPVYTTIQQAYLANNPAELTSLACASPEMAAYLQLKAGEMVGYSSSVAGYPANMQPALAYSADPDVPGGAAAWTQFQQRANKPNYATGAQFAIVPRQ